LAAFVAVGAWVGIRAFLAKGELDAALPLVGELRSQLADADTESAENTARVLEQHTGSARALVGDPVWRVVEAVPWVGPNLHAFRQAAEVVDTVASDAVGPLAGQVAAFGPESFQPQNGVVDLAPLIAVQSTVANSAAVLHQQAGVARGIDTSSTIGPISTAVEGLAQQLEDADTLLVGVNNAVTLLPKMLGAEGPRNNLLLFQNPAELRAGGGITSALALIRAENGAVSLDRQQSSGDFPVFYPPVADLAPDVLTLFTDRPAAYIQNTTLLPDFSQTGSIASAMWTNQFGDQIDSVFTFDPVALSYLLAATGPVTLPTGQQLTSENAVGFLLNQVYFEYPDTAVQDAVFASAARAVFDRVSIGGIDPRALLDALLRAGDEGRLKAWSSHADEQAVLASTTLAGGLPSVQGNQAAVGVYFNDATGGKMDYYLTTDVATSIVGCTPDGRLTVEVKATLANTAAADAGSAYPEYVTGAGNFGVPPGNVKTIVYIYSPAAGGPQPISITKLDPGIDGGSSFGGTDQTRTVTGFDIELAPGESRSVVVDYVLSGDQLEEVTLSTTPTIGSSVYSTEILGGFTNCEVR
jgi:hypothetical protein